MVRCVLDLTPACFGLQLCELYESSSYGAAWCEVMKDGCMGAVANYCHPADLWSSTPAGSEFSASDLVGGAFRSYGPCGTGHCPGSLAFSVRCVLGLAYPDSAAL